MTNKIAEALRFALENVFDEPNGWYPADIWPDKPGTVDEQIEAGRDEGAARASRSRELIRTAIPLAEAVPAVVEALRATIRQLRTLGTPDDAVNNFIISFGDKALAAYDAAVKEAE